MTITRAQVRAGAASLFTGALPPVRTVKIQPAVALAVAAGAALIEVVPPILSPGPAGGGSLNIARPRRLYKLLILGLITLYSGTIISLSGDYPIDKDIPTAGFGPVVHIPPYQSPAERATDIDSTRQVLCQYYLERKLNSERSTFAQFIETRADDPIIASGFDVDNILAGMNVQYVANNYGSADTVMEPPGQGESVGAIGLANSTLDDLPAQSPPVQHLDQLLRSLNDARRVKKSRGMALVDLCKVELVKE